MASLSKKVSPVTLMCEIAIMAAAGWVLDELAGSIFKGVFVNGGSIGIAMICVVIMTYRRGVIPGLAVGLIMGTFDLLTGPFMIASTPFKVVIQVLLDYVLAYPFVSLCALFLPFFRKATTRKDRLTYLMLGVLFGTLGKLLCHYLSGVLFWADPNGFAWGLTGMNPYLYCFVYNIAYVLPSGVISGIILALILQKAPQLYLIPNIEKEEKVKVFRHLEKKETIAIWVISFLALGLFGYFMYKYVASFYYGDYGQEGSEITFDPDSMVGWISGLLLIIVGIDALVRGRLGKYRESFYPYGTIFVGNVVIFYGLARIIRALIKNKTYDIYFLWIIGGLVLIAITLVYLLIKERRKNK